MTLDTYLSLVVCLLLLLLLFFLVELFMDLVIASLFFC